MSNRTIAISTQLSQHLDSWKKIQEKELALAGCIQNGDTPIVHSLKALRRNNKDSMVSIAGNLDGHNFDRWFRNFCADNDFGSYSVIKKEFIKNGKKHIRGTGYS